MLSWKSLEVVLIMLIVSVVLREAIRDPGSGLTLLVVIVRFGGVIKPGGVSVLGHGDHICEEGL